jgi:hypothetical protein
VIFIKNKYKNAIGSAHENAKAVSTFHAITHHSSLISDHHRPSSREFFLIYLKKRKKKIKTKEKAPRNFAENVYSKRMDGVFFILSGSSLS